MKFTHILTLALSLTLLSAHAQFQKPQWEMPFYFEDADGARDTVWIGYDPEASEFTDIVDTIFDEDYKPVNDSVFNAYLFDNVGLKTARKRSIISIDSNYPELPATIEFYNGKLPMKITWPDSLLNSDSLPFPDISPSHRGKAWIPNVLGVAYPDPLVPCDFSGYFTIVSDTAYKLGLSECLTEDSLVLTSPDNKYYTAENGIERLNLYIVPQDKPTGVGIEEREDGLVNFFPNPFHDLLTIRNITQSRLQLVLYNAYGREIIRKNIKEEQQELQLGHLPAGLYFLNVISKSGHSMFRLVKSP